MHRMSYWIFGQMIKSQLIKGEASHVPPSTTRSILLFASVNRWISINSDGMKWMCEQITSDNGKELKIISKIISEKYDLHILSHWIDLVLYAHSSVAAVVVVSLIRSVTVGHVRMFISISLPLSPFTHVSFCVVVFCVPRTKTNHWHVSIWCMWHATLNFRSSSVAAQVQFSRNPDIHLDEEEDRKKWTKWKEEFLFCCSF